MDKMGRGGGNETQKFCGCFQLCPVKTYREK